MIGVVSASRPCLARTFLGQDSHSFPSLNTRECHITMRFDAGKRTQLPVMPEAIRICMKQTLRNLVMVSDKIPYVWEACFKLEIGCIYLTLAEYSATQVWDRLERCRSALIRELGPSGLTKFVFYKHVAKVKILVSSVPLAPTGRGLLWKLEDWTGNRTCDGLRTNIEHSNPGVVTAGRSNMLGSVFVMKQAGATSCGIQLTLERNDASDKVISSGRIFLFGKSRNARFLRNTGRRRCVITAFRLVMLRCFVHSPHNVIFVLGITYRSPTDMGTLTVLVRMVNHVATRFVGVCYAIGPTTSPVITGVL